MFFLALCVTDRGPIFFFRDAFSNSFFYISLSLLYFYFFYLFVSSFLHDTIEIAMSKNNKRLDKKNRNLTDSLVLKRDSSCRGKENCTTTCYPNCNSGQECVSVWECGNCSVWQCIDNKIQLQVTATEFHTNNNDKRTILIAGLTTGLVCIIVGTIGVFAFYKRRRRRRPKLVEYHDDEKSFSIEPITPIKPAILPPSILDWTQQV